jgi:hypothetical protein
MARFEPWLFYVLTVGLPCFARIAVVDSKEKTAYLFSGMPYFWKWENQNRVVGSV